MHRLRSGKARRSFLFGLALAVLVGLLLVPLSVAAQDDNALAIEFEPVLTDLSGPVGYVDASDGSGRFFIVEKDGLILTSVGGELLETPFLDLSDQVSTGSEQGLLSMALDPEFADNGRAFVSYTDTEGDSQVVRYTVSAGDRNQLDPDSATTILSLDQPYRNHNGGLILFGPDGYLYLGFGDGGSQGDPHDNAQNPAVLLGKMLRIDVRGDQEPYGIPVDNPFVDDASFAPEIWASGFRNPWRFSFDRETGDLWIGDVGGGQIEEIDLIPSGSSGQNFGWSLFEGSICYDSEDCAEDDLTFPVFEYTHDFGCTVVGGYVYRGTSIPDLQGTYLFADYCSGNIWGLTANDDGTFTATEPLETDFRISSFAEDAGGELYVVDLNGSIFRIVAG